jgi:hypothetical protein
MRSSLKLVFAVATTAATVFGGSALAANPHSNGGPQTADCASDGSTTVSVNGPSTLWPPNHKSHDYTVAYAGTTTSGDTLTTTASSSDANAGVSNTDPQAATVESDGDSASTTTGLRSERAGASTGRTYTIAYSVDNSSGNVCTGSFTFTAPHDRGHRHNA